LGRRDTPGTRNTVELSGECDGAVREIDRVSKVLEDWRAVSPVSVGCITFTRDEQEVCPRSIASRPPQAFIRGLADIAVHGVEVCLKNDTALIVNAGRADK
jgi:hypothetical protein